MKSRRPRAVRGNSKASQTLHDGNRFQLGSDYFYFASNISQEAQGLQRPQGL